MPTRRSRWRCSPSRSNRELSRWPTKSRRKRFERGEGGPHRDVRFNKRQARVNWIRSGWQALTATPEPRSAPRWPAEHDAPVGVLKGGVG